MSIESVISMVTKNSFVLKLSKATITDDMPSMTVNLVPVTTIKCGNYFRTVDATCDMYPGSYRALEDVQDGMTKLKVISYPTIMDLINAFNEDDEE